MEKIILNNNIQETEFLRTCARLGIKSFGLRLFNDNRLIEYIMAKTAVNPLKGTYITSKEGIYILMKELNKKLSDCSSIMQSLNFWRECEVINPLKTMEDVLNNEFELKKNTFINAFKKYSKYKEANNLYDKYDLFKVLLENKNISKSLEEIYFFKEFPLTKIETQLIHHVFKNVKEESLNNYFKNKNEKINVTKAYGKTCEIDHVFSEISNYKLGDCQIILLDQTELPFIDSLSKRLNIKCTYRDGLPLINTNPGILLQCIRNMQNKQFGVNAYQDLLNCSSFIKEKREEFLKVNDFLKYVGWLRISFFERNNDLNKSLYKKDVSDAIEKFTVEVNQGLASFIENNCNIIGPYDLEAMTKIKDALAVCNRFFKDDLDKQLEIIDNLLSSSVGFSISSPDALHITNLDNAFESLRDNNFIVGLTSDFPGQAKEDYFIFDEEFKLIDDKEFFLSTNKISRKNNTLKNLISISKNADISYAFYNFQTLKKCNPSSLIYDYCPNADSLKPYSLKNMAFDNNSPSIKDYLDHKNTILKILNKNGLKDDISFILNYKFSPSKIANYFQDGELNFILDAVCKITIDGEEDSFDVLPANEKGTIIHRVIEGFQKDKISKELLLQKAQVEFDKFLMIKPPLITGVDTKVKKDFMDLISNIFDDDPGNKFVEGENYYEYTFPNGLKVGGKADRIEQDNKGNYILVDYKTGRTVKHDEDNPITFIQGLIYAYIIEKKKHIKIDKITFRYPFIKNKEVTINNDAKNQKIMMDALDNLIESIKNKTILCPNDKNYDYLDQYSHLISLLNSIKTEAKK